MKLQILKHSIEDVPYETPITLVHIVDNSIKGGEVTICGRVIPDSNIEIDGWQMVGQEYNGTLRNVTCPICRRILYYYKHLR